MKTIMLTAVFMLTGLLSVTSASAQNMSTKDAEALIAFKWGPDSLFMGDIKMPTQENNDKNSLTFKKDHTITLTDAENPDQAGHWEYDEKTGEIKVAVDGEEMQMIMKIISLTDKLFVAEVSAEGLEMKPKMYLSRRE